MLYGSGYHCFWQRNYAEALEYFNRAIQNDPEDARYWYYKGFSEQAMGDESSAAESLARAVQLHSEGKPGAGVVGKALERIQGYRRQMVEEARENAAPVQKPRLAPLMAAAR
jgi:tetratricopeptide (TPR) repeat protein